MKKLLLCSFLFYLSNLHAQTLNINVGWPYPQATLIINITKAVFKEAKIDVNMQVVPNKRSLISANEGVDDGDATRIWKINTFYPNLHRVPVQTYGLNIVAISNKKLMIKKLDDLKPYNIGVLRGMKIVEVKAEGIKSKSLIKVNTHKTLIHMLKNNRIDIALSDEKSLLQEIKKSQTKGLYLFEKPLMVLPMYIHLHKKHKYLIPQLSTAIKTLEKKQVLTKINEDFNLKFNQSLKNLIHVIKNH